MKNNDKKFFKTLNAAFAMAEDVKKQVELKIEGIDEKYRLLAEKEKAALVKAVDSLSSQIAEYKKLLSQYTESNAEDSEQKENVTTQDTTAEEPEEVVDTIFSDNNEPESSDETEDTTEEETTDDEAEVESTTENDSWFEESDESNNSDNVEEGEPITDDGWPEVPEEWK